VVIGKDFYLDFDITKSVKRGEKILIEDGLIELCIDKVESKKIFCTVVVGGLIQSHKGINLPMSRIKFSVLTEKDKQDLLFGLNLGLDFIAISFVRNRKDILDIKKIIKTNLPKNFIEPKVVAKIEKPEAVKNFNSILKVVDWVMVARGDLGVEVPDFKVPIIQKTIIAKCLKVNKPVIVATQMLDSMIRNPHPTRAEVSDVANAVLDGATCVMLSGESAFGKYPIESVSNMAEIIQYTEKSKLFKDKNFGNV
jgi:pyruvate kinase